AGSANDFRDLVAHLARRYDNVFVSAPVAGRGAVAAAAGAAGEAVLCVRTSRTTMRALHRLLVETRDAGVVIRGVVLWETEDPALATAAEGRAGGRGAGAELEDGEPAGSARAGG
ncbi:MAG: hypothetical protein WKG32_24170, partial [Gemmatimonadaceae bacterium]